MYGCFKGQTMEGFRQLQQMMWLEMHFMNVICHIMKDSGQNKANPYHPI